MPQDSPCLKVDGNLLTAVPVGIVRNESRDLGNLLRVDASHRAESPKITFLAEVPGDGHSMVIVERSEEHTSELQSLMRISYAVFCLKKKNKVRIIQELINLQLKIKVI